MIRPFDSLRSLRARLVLAAVLALGATLNAQVPMLTAGRKPTAGSRYSTAARWRGGAATSRRLRRPAGRAANGELVRNGDGGDLMTVEQYSDFELRLEWKISENGNSGIMYHVVTRDENPYESGPEFQILHNAGHKDGAVPNPVGGIELRDASAGERRDQAGRPVERHPADRERHARRALDERREAARVRAVQPRLVRAAPGQQVQQDAAATAATCADTSCCRTTATWSRSGILRSRPFNDCQATCYIDDQPRRFSRFSRSLASFEFVILMFAAS